MRAEILSVGTELLLGQIVDTNANFLAQQLPPLGLDLFYVSQIGDNLERLTSAFKLALQRSDIIITTGGLGPTEDDLTREAIAQVRSGCVVEAQRRNVQQAEDGLQQSGEAGVDMRDVVLLEPRPRR